jgi:hypothetical protein
MEVSYAKRKKSLILTLGLATLVIQAIAMRVRAHSTFRVQPPMNIGAWEIKSIPLSSEAMSALGNPDVDGWNYTNALDEFISKVKWAWYFRSDDKPIFMKQIIPRSRTSECVEIVPHELERWCDILKQRVYETLNRSMTKLIGKKQLLIRLPLNDWVICCFAAVN